MLAEFKETTGGIVRVVTDKVEGLRSYSHGCNQVDIVCSNRVWNVKGTLDEVENELQRVAEELRKQNCLSVT